MKEDLRLYEPVECSRCLKVFVWCPEHDYWLTPLFDKGRVCDSCFTELVNAAHPGVAWA